MNSTPEKIEKTTSRVLRFRAVLVGVLFGVAVQLGRGLSLTLFYEALNRRMPGDFRATVNSLVSLLVRGLFIVTGPVLGLALDHFGEISTLLALVLIFAPLFALVVMGLGLRIRREHAQAAAPALAG